MTAQQRTLHDLPIRVEFGACLLAIIVREEDAHERVGVLIGIPHQFGNHVSTQFGEVCSLVAVHLLKQHIGVVAVEELDVGCQDMEVGEWCYHIVEVDAIVPDEDVVGDATPSLQGPYKVASALVVRQRHLALGVNAAEHDVDVGKRFDQSWRLHTIEVGEGRELLVRVARGQAVEKSDDWAAGRTFLRLHLRAFLAMAIGKVAVILTDGDHFHARVAGEDTVEVVADLHKQLLIGQTPLAVRSRLASAIDEGIPFRMCLPIDAAWENLVESVYPQVVHEHLVGTFHSIPIDKQRVALTIAYRLSVAEGRSLRPFDGGQL